MVFLAYGLGWQINKCACSDDMLCTQIVELSSLIGSMLQKKYKASRRWNCKDSTEMHEIRDTYIHVEVYLSDVWHMICCCVFLAKHATCEGVVLVSVSLWFTAS